jgi:hypothetical protein
MRNLPSNCNPKYSTANRPRTHVFHFISTPPFRTIYIIPKVIFCCVCVCAGRAGIC